MSEFLAFWDRHFIGVSLLMAWGVYCLAFFEPVLVKVRDRSGTPLGGGARKEVP